MNGSFSRVGCFFPSSFVVSFEVSEDDSCTISSGSDSPDFLEFCSIDLCVDHHLNIDEIH